MGDVVVRLENVSKFYKLYNSPGDRLKEALSPFGKTYHKDFYALKNINLEIKKGEVLGIVGKNGCGKSTLLKLISKVLTPNEGNLVVNGKISALLELGSGFNPEFTGLQNIFFYGSILGFSREDMEVRLDDILSFADIGEFINQQIKTYSSGMKARLGFAVAIHVDPEILILDEVLSVGDVLFQRKCYAKMEDFFQSGKTVIFVSHASQSVVQFCSRAILLYNGELILDGDPKKVTDCYQSLVLSKNHQLVLDQIKGVFRENIEEIKENIDENDKVFSTPRYLPNLKSIPQVEYKVDVEIFNVKMLNSSGERVNVLETGESYEYVYKVKFLRPYNDVSFGMHFKTLKGFGLTSSATHFRREKVLQVAKDTVYTVKWSFVCNFLSNVYLSNAGVYINNGSVLSRMVDSYMFKVDSHNLFKVGYLNLEQDVTFDMETL